MKGWVTYEGTIIELTAKRTNADRHLIIKFYRTLFRRDVIEDMKDKLYGNLRQDVLKNSYFITALNFTKLRKEWN